MSHENHGPVGTDLIRRLQGALSPEHLALSNDSDQHRGHAGHDGSGESHFSLEIVSSEFAGLNRVQRQRLIYRALGDLLQTKVHALQIKAAAPGE